MIISDSIAPIETIALPEPYQRSLGSIPSEGWESVLKIAESGRVWRLEFGADARPQTRPTGLGLRREPEFDDFEPIDFAADRLVLEFDEHLHVFDVSTGRVRLRVSVRDGGGASCLTPDGRLLLRFNEDETKIWTFAEEPPLSRTTRLFHEDSEPLPCSAMSAIRQMRKPAWERWRLSCRRRSSRFRGRVFAAPRRFRAAGIEARRTPPNSSGFHLRSGDHHHRKPTSLRGRQ